LVTHSLRYARKNCDRLLWLDRGEIRAIGEPAEVIEKYKETIPVKVRRPRKRLELKKTEANVKERTVVKAENIGMSFNFKNETFWALKNVSFDIKEGEVVAIIGHNGAGKSTLCKLLTKILTPDEGELELSGETTSLLSYGTGFNAQLSGKDNVYLNGMLLGIPKERVAQEYPNIVAFSELEKH
ncbi:ATP-binding cassette domain-containing protein, partial [Halalkalibacterium halodurans]